MHQPLTILYCDDDLIAVHKPAGLLVHRSSIDSRAARFLLQVVRDQIGAAVHPVHRLDKATSGIVVFARHALAASRLAQSFRDGEVAKTYLAVVRGWAPGAVDVDHPLRDIADRRSRRQTLDTREAFTAVRCLARAELATAVGRYPTARYSLVSCRPRTGRRHQIRRHLKHLRHPIIGDVNYGDGAHNRFFRDALGIRRLLLTASLLGVPHPRTAQPIEIHAPLEASFLDALAWPEWQGVATDES